MRDSYAGSGLRHIFPRVQLSYRRGMVLALTALVLGALALGSAWSWSPDMSRRSVSTELAGGPGRHSSRPNQVFAATGAVPARTQVGHGVADGLAPQSWLTSPAGSPTPGGVAATPREAGRGALTPGTGSPTSDPSSGGQVCGGGNVLTPGQRGWNGTTGGWGGENARVAWVPSPARSTRGALEVTATGNGPMAAWSGRPGSGELTSGAPGCLYSGDGWLLSSGAPISATPVLDFYGGSGSLLASVPGQATLIGPTAWGALAPVVAIAPPATTLVGLVIELATVAAGQAVYLDSPQLSATAGPATSGVVGPLGVEGNRILQGNGRPLIMRGFVVAGLDSSANPTSVSEQLIDQAKAWGANVIRVALGEQLWLSQSCAYDPTYASTVSRLVDWITSRHMVALLDLHFNQPSDLNAAPGICPPAAQQLMADSGGSPEFWRQVSARFANNPLVAFDLYNEPHDISDQVWLDGGTVPIFLVLPYQAAGMQELYDAVRSTGAQNLVLVSGNNWANSPPPTLVKGTNIAYAVHAYTCPGDPPPGCSSSDPFNPVPILGQWAGLSQSVPVVVSEFGWPSAYDGTYDRNVVGFAEAHGWGWIGFAWSVGPPWGLIAPIAAGGTAEPTPAAMPLLGALWTKS